MNGFYRIYSGAPFDANKVECVEEEGEDDQYIYSPLDDGYVGLHEAYTDFISGISGDDIEKPETANEDNEEESEDDSEGESEEEETKLSEKSVKTKVAPSTTHSKVNISAVK